MLELLSLGVQHTLDPGSIAAWHAPTSQAPEPLPQLASQHSGHQSCCWSTSASAPAPGFVATTLTQRIKHQCHYHQEGNHKLDQAPRGSPSATIPPMKGKDTGWSQQTLPPRTTIAITTTVDTHSLGP